MPTYSLEFLIDPQDLIAIKAAQQNIVLAKAVSGTPSPNVAWQSFAPGQNDVVTWSEEYGIYASNTHLAPGARILKTSSLPYAAQEATYYTFEADANFHGPYQGPEVSYKHHYGVINEVPPAHYPSLVFGLVQSATINNTPTKPSPINAQSVPAHHYVTFKPLSSVYIWLQSDLSNGSVITQMPCNVAIITLSSSAMAHTLKYDAERRTFVPYTQIKHSFTAHHRSYSPTAAW